MGLELKHLKFGYSEYLKEGNERIRRLFEFLLHFTSKHEPNLASLATKFSIHSDPVFRLPVTTNIDNKLTFTIQNPKTQIQKIDLFVPSLLILLQRRSSSWWLEVSIRSSNNEKESFYEHSTHYTKNPSSSTLNYMETLTWISAQPENRRGIRIDNFMYAHKQMDD